jgi:hypothetical protein
MYLYVGTWYLCTRNAAATGDKAEPDGQRMCAYNRAIHKIVLHIHSRVQCDDRSSRGNIICKWIDVGDIFRVRALCKFARTRSRPAHTLSELVYFSKP